MPFFEFRQNNSGGTFIRDHDRSISISVIVEAVNAAEANSRAESIGLYFDGAGDCRCCGDRWYRQSEPYDDGDPTPSRYGAPLADEEGSGAAWVQDDEADTYVHYLDGSVLGYHGTKIVSSRLTVGEAEVEEAIKSIKEAANGE